MKSYEIGSGRPGTISFNKNGSEELMSILSLGPIREARNDI